MRSSTLAVPALLAALVVPMRVLVACEFSGVVRDAFRARGHDAWSCDLLPCERSNEWHFQCDIFALLGQMVRTHNIKSWDLMIAHPPCTYLTNAGVRHMHEGVASRNGVKAKVHGRDRWRAMVDAAQFFNGLKNAQIYRIAIENPIPHKYARDLIGAYQQKYQPWQFGEEETKATCLWLKNLPPLMDTITATKRVPRVHRESPGPDRWKNRSRTLPGIAAAMADQWGELE